MDIHFHNEGRAGRGLTLVELAIVAVVIAVILAFMIPVLREREHARLQALATASPGAVFELRCSPAEEVVRDGEDFIIVGELLNPTRYALNMRWDATIFTVPAVDGESAYILPWIVVESRESEVEPAKKLRKPYKKEEVRTIGPRSKLFFKARLLRVRVSPGEGLTGKVSLRDYDKLVVPVSGVGSFIVGTTTQLESNDVSFKILRPTAE